MQALLCGYYGFGNGGDEALLATLLQMLPPQVSPLVLSGDPKATAQLHGVETCSRQDPVAIFRAMRRSQAFIWGGGSLIQDATSRFSPVYYTGLMGLAQGMGLTTIAWAQGIGPLNHPTTKVLARRSFQGCAAISVRDAASAALASNWGLFVTLAPDPVWALEAQPPTAGELLPPPRVAVALRSHPHLTPARLQALTEALQLFQAKTQTSILLLPFQPVQDLAIAQFIHAQMPEVSQLLQLTNPRALKGVLQSVEMAIAMRLHALIMAAAEGCRCFAISYDPKVQQLVKDVACPSWELDQLSADPQTMMESWLDHYLNGQGLGLEQIRDRVDQSLRHQQVLHTALDLAGQA